LIAGSLYKAASGKACACVQRQDTRAIPKRWRKLCLVDVVLSKFFQNNRYTFLLLLSEAIADEVVPVKAL
jgi:hypothetical protein